MLQKYWNERTLNPYYFVRSKKPLILSVIVLAICGVWIFFYSFQMNFVTLGDCYALQLLSDGSWINHDGSGSTKTYSKSVNMSYKFRLLCVLGVTVWSQIAFLGLAQICRPLRLLTAIIGIYTILAYITWLIAFSLIMHGDEA